MSPLDMFPETVAPLPPEDDNNRRYTPASFMEWIRAKAGVEAFDLDPAADAESHWAPRWFSVQPYAGSAGVNGLEQDWLPTIWPPLSRAERGSELAEELLMEIVGWCIFVNPPFDDLGAWIEKAWATCARAYALRVPVRIAFVLPGNRHEQPFWQRDIEPFRDGRAERFGYRLECHFPPGRVAYAKPGSNGQPVGSADFPSCLLVWRRA